MSSSSTLVERFRAVVSVLDAVPTALDPYRSLPESELLEIARLAGDSKRLTELHAALAAGEIARRSTRDLGHAGLAQRNGFRNTVELLKSTGGVTATEASRAVRVGSLVQDAEPVDFATGELLTPTEPWLTPLTNALARGDISTAQVDSLRAGLGAPSQDITAEMLTPLAVRLAVEAVGLDPERAFTLARQLRDEIDEQGVIDRELAAIEKRTFSHRTHADGSGRAIWDLDPETNASFTAVKNRILSPRLGGPRFIDARNADLAEQIVTDPRTTGQLLSDVLIGLILAGSDTDATQLLGNSAPHLVVLATEKTIIDKHGHGHLEGSNTAVSYNTIERLGCAGAIETIVFNAKFTPVDSSPASRLYSRAQRRAMAARDGGCLIPGCPCPPMVCEAHHIKWVTRDRGETTVPNGILLCRFHHLMIHNLGWEIVPHAHWLALIPPTNVDPLQRPIPLESKSPAYKKLKHEARELALAR